MNVSQVSREKLERYLEQTRSALELLKHTFALTDEDFQVDYVNINQKTHEIEQEDVTISPVIISEGQREYWIAFSCVESIFKEKEFADAKEMVMYVLGKIAIPSIEGALEGKQPSPWIKFRERDFEWAANGKPYLIGKLKTHGIRGLVPRDAWIWFNRVSRPKNGTFVIWREEWEREKSGNGNYDVHFPVPVEEQLATEAFEQHETLNQKLWDGEGLKQEVREHLFEILAQYIADSAFLKEEDIITANIVGSNASYNYTDNSDLDLHLVVDMSSLSKDPQFVQIAADGERALFNKRYDLQFAGIGVELYVEDAGTSVISNGIYDLFEDRWIKKPEKYTANIDYAAYDAYYQKIRAEAEQTLLSDDVEEVQAFINKLYERRKYSLLQYGEPGDDNQVFKDLRSVGLVEKLKERANELRSKELSIEDSILEALEEPSRKRYR